MNRSLAFVLVAALAWGPAAARAEEPLDPDAEAAQAECGMALLTVALVQGTRTLSDTAVALQMLKEKIYRCQAALATAEAARQRLAVEDEVSTADEVAEEEAAIEALRNDRGALRIASSAGLCAANLLRSRARDVLLVDDKNGGQALRQILVADKRAKLEFAMLSRMGTTPLPCASPLVARITACLDGDPGGDCATPTVRRHLALVDEP